MTMTFFKKTSSKVATVFHLPLTQSARVTALAATQLLLLS